MFEYEIKYEKCYKNNWTDMSRNHISRLIRPVSLLLDNSLIIMMQKIDNACCKKDKNEDRSFFFYQKRKNTEK